MGAGASSMGMSIVDGVSAHTTESVSNVSSSNASVNECDQCYYSTVSGRYKPLYSA